MTPLTELRPEDLEGLTGTGDEQVNNTREDDLDMHEVDEEEMLLLLPQQALTNPLSFSQQGASTSAAASFSQTALTSAALNQGASTSAQALPLVTALNQPSDSMLLPLEKINYLNTLIPSNREKIYCILEVLDNNKGKLLTKKALIEVMKAKYINFDNTHTEGAFHHAFTHAINMGLIQKSGHHSDIDGIVYRLGVYGLAALEYLKKDIVPKLVHRTTIATHSNDGQ